ncbi:hypothetical protein ACU8MP_33180 (plasmid) [Rhizobium leguminosarum]|uniref:hypothetical protein n=1 Tax=Rhizobium leguminosarum TaxID=384 RepID=UPI0014427D5E|nr:hypothetical protein [Rhizobium leguminosarum]MBA9034346.1 hypothetical protein [Rhizobium leguminosarum]
MTMRRRGTLFLDGRIETRGDPSTRRGGRQHGAAATVAAARTLGRDAGLAVRFAHDSSPEILGDATGGASILGLQQSS